jgi:hypothetical protein
METDCSDINRPLLQPTTHKPNRRMVALALEYRVEELPGHSIRRRAIEAMLYGTVD